MAGKTPARAREGLARMEAADVFAARDAEPVWRKIDLITDEQARRGQLAVEGFPYAGLRQGAISAVRMALTKADRRLEARRYMRDFDKTLASQAGEATRLTPGKMIGGAVGLAAGHKAAEAKRKGDYSAAEIARVGFLAGRGASAKEIAEALESTPERIYGLCHRVGITLTPKGQGYVSIVAPVDRVAMQAIERAAIEHDVEPAAMAGRLLREIADDPDLLRSLVVDVAHSLQPI